MAARGLLVACLLIGGCGHEDNAQEEAAPSGETDARLLAKKEWLGKLDAASPGEWLASRLSARGPGRSVHQIDEIPVVLSGAARVFGESPRMIVNRAVQLETMLEAGGADESALDLIADLSSTVTKKGGAEGFGARCQHYYILRIAERNTRDEALAILKRKEFKDR